MQAESEFDVHNITLQCVDQTLVLTNLVFERFFLSYSLFSFNKSQIHNLKVNFPYEEDSYDLF